MGLNIDWDDWLSYNTVKVVRIRDRRLGLLHITFMLAIFIYIVVVSVFINKGYLNVEAPIGSIRTSLHPPSTYRYPLSYCAGQPGVPNTFPNLPCQYWDESLISFPAGERDSFTASSRVRIITQTSSHCDFYNPNCRYADLNETNIYVGDIESFTLEIDHTMYAPNTGVQKNAVELSGFIKNEEGNDVTLDDGTSTIGIPGSPDIIKLGTLLSYANVDLDSESLTNSSNTIRYDGINIFVFISYSNIYTTNLNKFRYTYEVSAIDDTSFTVIEPIYTTDVLNRILFKRHGIRLLFIQTGSIGKFEFQQLLLTLVSGIGLLAISTIIVDQLAIRILPQKKTYSSFKFQVTEGVNNNRMKKIVHTDDGDEIMYSNIENL